jgi:hypothetical protein
MTKTINLEQLTVSQGFNITGSSSSRSGYSVSWAGDMNGDGIPDFIVGAFYANSYAGKAYVIYGGSSLSNIDLDNLTIEQGFMISGNNYHDGIGYSVSWAGDVNKDGYADIIVGSDYINTSSGKAYIIFGGPSLVNVNVNSLTPTQGITITGFNYNDGFGTAVGGVGDVNKDGYDDFAVGAPTTYDAESYTGEVYVIYGGPSLSDINVGSMTLAQGITITGTYNSYIGYSISGADVNKNGYSDVLIGSDRSLNTYVIYGGPSPSNVNLANFSATQGVTISGAAYSVSGAGDFNGDGYPDIISGSSSGGKCYVVYGSDSLPSYIDLLYSLTTTQGIVISGGSGGCSVGAAGDVNGDGYADVIVGFYGESKSYVIYGGPSLGNINVDSLSSEQGFSMIGSSGSFSGNSVSGVGDLKNNSYSTFLLVRHMQESLLQEYLL